MKIRLLVLIITVFSFSCTEKPVVPFQDNLENYPLLSQVLKNKEKYNVQIIYTQIDRNEHGNPLMTDFNFNLNDSLYFYPASTVKLPVAILALEWLEEQTVKGIDMETTMLTDSIRPSQHPAFVDNSSKDSLPSIAQYIRKIFLVSDNDAYNRLYELLGQDYINEKLKERGFHNTVINQRLSTEASVGENREFNPIRFVDKSGKALLRIPERHTKSVYENVDNPTIGTGFYQNDSLIKHGMDFRSKNKFSLSDFHGVVQRIIFPQAFVETQRFQLTDEHRNFILKYMSMLPRESDFPSYPPAEFWDTYSKFFQDGNDKGIFPAGIRIFNKTGQAYGHLIDASYFVDLNNGIEFFVSAIIYVNENATLNDDHYQYDIVGFPFFAELGDYLYELELGRKKAIPADLRPYQFDY
jgi:hypothetical protein